MLTILIADDEQHIRQGIANSINWQKLHISNVLQGVDGEQSLQIASENKIDILLTDIRMPFIDGIELSRKVLDLYSDCIIIFMSAYSDKDYLMSAIELKATNYIEKPIKISELTNILANAVKKIEEMEYKRIKNIMLEKNYKISIPLIKNEIALLSANKNSDKDLLLDYINNSMLGITADSSYISVIFKVFGDFTINSFGKGSKPTNLFSFEELSNILSSNGLKCLWGSRDDREYIIHIYNDCSNYSYLDQDQIISLLKQWLKQYEKNKYFVSMGIIVPDFTHIFKSYSCAKIALSKCFYRGYGSIVKYTNNIAKVDLMEKELVEQFKDSLGSKDHKTVYKLLQDFSDQLRRYEDDHIDAIKNTYCKLVTILLSNIQKYGSSCLSDYEDESSLRSDLQSKNTLDEVKEFCNNLLNSYYNSLSKLHDKKNISIIINYIEEHFSNKTLDINQISQNTFLSPAYLCTYFKRETGKTINQYITDYRLEKAKEFLKDKKNSISDIAKMTGYDNNYFSRIFKKRFNLSPTEYREKKE